MKNIRFVLVIAFLAEPERHNVNIGSVTLQKDGREYILDVTQSRVEGVLNELISCELEIDQETFPDCKYDLTPVDLLNLDVAEVFVGYEDDGENAETATLLVVSTNPDGSKSTRAIDLTFE